MFIYFGDVGRGEANDTPHFLHVVSSHRLARWSNCGGTRENGVPLPFLAGERRFPSLHDRCGWTRKTAFGCSMTATYNISNRTNVR